MAEISLHVLNVLNDQISGVINGGTTTQYFNLERDACRGDPISAYLFLLTLEMLFLLSKKHPVIKDIEIFEQCFLILITQMIQPIAYLFELFNTFPVFSGLKPNLKKMRNSGNRSPERNSVGTLWCEMH